MEPVNPPNGPSADIGLIGLAVMGQNLVLNMNDHGYQVVAYNRTSARTTEFLNGPARDTNVIGVETIDQLVAALTISMILRGGFKAARSTKPSGFLPLSLMKATSSSTEGTPISRTPSGGPKSSSGRD